MIERRGRVVEHQYGTVLCERPRNADALLLPAGKADAALANDRLILLFHLLDKSLREDEFMENTDKKKIFRRLFSYLMEYKGILIAVLLCMGVTVAISLVNPGGRL